jgi:hypothetical protein
MDTVYLVRKVENLKEITITSNRELNSKIQFTKLSSLKKGIHSFGSELVNGKIYVIGGDASIIEDAAKRTLDELSNTPESTFGDFMRKTRMNNTWEKYTGNLQIYDILDDTWTSSELKFRERAYHTINYCNNRLYVLGGKNLSRNKKFEYLDDKIEVFDLKNQSITIDNTNPHQATSFASFVYNKSIIVIGGSIKMAKDGRKNFSNKVHLYDLETGYWYELNDMPKGKEVKGVIIKNTIYFIGGYNNIPLSEIESYNITTGKWENEGELFYGIENPALTFYENVIYIFNDGKILTYNMDTEVLNEYEIDLDLMASELYYYNNKLYILGGYISDEFSKSPSPNLYSIDMNEFLNTKIIMSKKNKL